MPRTASFNASDFHTTTARNPASRNDGRELVVFESLVALLALLLIISGFSLYVSHAFSAPSEALPGGGVKVSTQSAVERPLSLVEA